jgi:alkylation response protein AidB-like acyl-CoA dehydrogenase
MNIRGVASRRARELSVALPSIEEVRAEVRTWLAENFNPDLSVGEWWDCLARSGYAAPTFPEDAWGRGYDRARAAVVSEEIANAGAIGAPSGLGYALAAPTIARHGNDSQKQHELLRILNGQDAWCQLFSEPGAGSDLAGLQAKAERDGDEFIVNGQKVWTSTAQLCNLGMLIARTDPDQPKHVGITYFKFDMTQPGVEVRPLREMTGRAMFNEVFMDNCRVNESDIIGGYNNGWAVANTTLAAERSSLGSGGGGAMGSAFPGPMAGHLDKPVRDFVGQVRTGGTGGGGLGMVERLISLAKETDKITDPVIRQGIARIYSMQQIGNYSALRMRGGGASAAAPNLAKLMMSDMLRLNRHVGNQIIGADGMIMGAATLGHGLVQEMTLFSPGPSIYGGSDQVQRNIIGERALGLPKEPGPDKTTPFNQLLVNASR